VQSAVEGEPFMIARSGKPAVMVVPVEEPPKKLRELGFMKDEAHKWKVPDDFNTFMQDEIIEMFYGKDEKK
jgi:antitoxin (DNA-binding transcriptional repressor) of toxin-antitoxin stability system